MSDPDQARLVHQPALDGLRGVAVAGVLLFHGGYLTGGYLGVDAFFVLSGFLITSLLLAEARDRGAIALGSFWARRARRLMPALACVLAFVAIYAAFVARPEELTTIRGDALATIAYVANWRQIFTSQDYFALFRSPSPLQHTWSLAIEEQFYLVWPLVVFALVRGRAAADAARRVLVASVALAAASMVWSQVAYQLWGATRVYYGTDTRIASIAIGAGLASVLAFTGPVRIPRARRVLESAGVAAGIGLAVAWVRLSGSSWLLYRGGLVVCGVATAVVIAAAVHPDRGQVHRVLSWKPLRGLGLVSYGVYLWHWPLFVVLDSSRVHLGGWPLFSVRVATTLAVSIASYRWIEQPIRRGAFRPRVALAAGAAVASVLVGAIVVATAGTLPAQTITLPPTSGGVLVVGNSLGINLGFALDRAGLGVSIHSTAGCSLVPGKFNIRGGTPARSCGPFGEWVKAQRPQFVLLMELGAPGDATTVTVDGNTTAVTSSRYREMYKTDLQDAIDKLSATGATIIVPNVPCWGDNAEVPSSQRPQFNARLVEENELLHEVVTQPENRARVVSPDLRKFVCPLDRFQRSLGNVADARPDGAHFSPQGADVVARWLLQQVPSLSAAKRTPHSLADDLFDRLNAGAVYCTFRSSGKATDQPFVSIATCAYLGAPKNAPRLGTLRVDRRPRQLASYARKYRAIACATANASAPGGRIAYLLRPYWIFTGTAAPDAARALATPLTYFTC